MMRIRGFEPDDLDALYQISLATGLAGGDASHLYEDGRLIGHIYSAPYALLEPELAFVVVDDEGVGGYVVGVTNTEAWEERLERDWWPRLRADYLRPREEDSSDWTPDQHRTSMIFHPERTPASVAQEFPAHLHMNILPRFQGQGVGSKLFAAWMEEAARREVAALHIGANRRNVGAIKFWGKMGFVEIPDAGRWLWMGRRLERGVSGI